jgi:hypothetical protein
MLGGRALAGKMELSAGAEKRTVSELTRQPDRGILKATDRPETDGATA